VRLFLAVTCLLISTNVLAQAPLVPVLSLKHRTPDTAYIKDFYNHYIVFRLYESTKFNNYQFADRGNKITYKPNNHNNLGFGFNYKFISVNLGFFVPFLSKDKNKYGTTQTLDLQTHLYLQRFIVDLYGQFYNGYYLANPSSLMPNTIGYVLRPDLHTRDISAVVQYVFNYKKYSYNAAYYQNEYQKKSAGSFIAGAGIYHTDAKADSALISPATVYTNFYEGKQFNKIANNSIALSLGYTYTYVYKQHFFLTGSLSGGAGLNISVTDNTDTYEKHSRLAPEYNITGRAAAGYNSNVYFAGVTYVRLVTESGAPFSHTFQDVNAGNFRVIVAKRFRIKNRSLLDKAVKAIPVQ
jgi:hypothetical protein